MAGLDPAIHAITNQCPAAGSSILSSLLSNHWQVPPPSTADADMRYWPVCWEGGIEIASNQKRRKSSSACGMKSCPPPAQAAERGPEFSKLSKVSNAYRPSRVA